jgi:1,4-dihydroxy-2-naphthoyl-CoA hydrolase
MTDPRIAERYDEKLAASFLRANDQLTGLPEFLGVRLTSFEPGRLTAEMAVHERLLTPFGNMHGGVISAVCDHVLGCVCYPHMPKGSWAATTEFKINLLAPVSGGRLEAVAEIISMSKSTAVVRIDVSNDGRACAAAQGTVTLRPPRDPKPG